jgi:hypothetical protein
MKKFNSLLRFTLVILILLLFSLGDLTKTSVEAAPQLDYLLLNQMTTDNSLPFIDEENGNVAPMALSTTMSINCSPSELIDAINQANTNPGADVIDLDAECSYEFSRADNVDLEYWNNALPIVTGELTINGNGATIFSSNDNMRAFLVAAGANLSINNLEVSDFSNDYEGGAILNQGTITIKNLTFNNNTGFNGGAIYNLGQAIIFNSTFYQNSACC